ncbi:MAG: hypothetical protein HOO91_01115 [Bacteroidales bacterium]|nr:hypothetical protein [Bacteroidales bacterium]
MSKLEQKIQDELLRNGINFEIQKPVPIDNYPWQTSRSMTSPKCDIYLTDLDLYIEVKGFMTYRAVSKLSYLSRQSFNYYIFQGTEPQWNPTIDTYLKFDKIANDKEARILNFNINHQLKELINLKSNSEFLDNISQTTLKRLKNYIDIKIDEYKSWNGEWY